MEQQLTLWQRRTLSLLLDKYEGSKTYLETNLVKQNFRIPPSMVFPDYTSDFADLTLVTDFEQQLHELEAKGWIRCQRSKTRGEISGICAVPGYWPDYYQALNRVAKKDRQARLLEIYRAYETCIFLKNFGEQQCNRIAAGKTPQFDEEKACAILKLCLFLETNQTAILERELSVEVLGDTKLWEKQYRSTVCRLIRNTGKYDQLLSEIEEKREWEALLLEEFQVYANPSHVWIKGNAILTLKTGQKICVYEGFPMALSYEIVKELLSIEIKGNEVMTIENLASFNRIRIPNIFFLFLSGYHSKIKKDILVLIASQNPHLNWQHFGDIDPDGFDIVEHLRRSTKIPFKTYHMGITELQDYATYTKPLENNDRMKAASLLEIEEYAEVVQYMLDHDCKLEQEIISWKST